MQIRHHFSLPPLLKAGIAAGIFILLSFLAVSHVQAAADTETSNGRLITIYDRGQKRVILTHAQTVSGAVKDAGIKLSSDDVVEPKATSKLVASNYTVNIYRARPVIVVDGMMRQKIMTAAQTAKAIVASVNGTLQDEDVVTMSANENIVADGAGVVLTIDRATSFTLKLYGKVMTTYSQEDTVGEMLDKKGIKLATNDTVSIARSTPLTAGMTVEVWREGVQTTTVEEVVDFPVRTVIDADQPVGYHEIQTVGTKGKKDVVYEITAEGGKEISRKIIQSVVTEQPKEQVEIMGSKPSPGSLTKSKGAQQYRDSKGVVHRETYYDLPMNIVMGACGGGRYTVRVDGAKVDKDGYILVAAHLGNYPRCSIVETSMGLGKVYDTGGFTAKHPYGFDLATDWTKSDGR